MEGIKRNDRPFMLTYMHGKRQHEVWPTIDLDVSVYKTHSTGFGHQDLLILRKIPN